MSIAIWSPLYGVFNVMKQRCSNPKCKSYHHYGGRGIKVCEEWTAPNGWDKFAAWAADSGYRQGLTIDRYPNKDGDYEPSNCRWVTRAENLRNRRMTPKWAAAIRAMRQSPAFLNRTFTEDHKAKMRINMAKARKAELERRAKVAAAKL